MTVYEMIQKLSKYDADLEVEINAYSENYRATVEVEEDVKEGEETDVDVEFDLSSENIEIDDFRRGNGERFVRILSDMD